MDVSATSLSCALRASTMDLTYRFRAARPGNKRKPLLVLLHGVGGDEMSLAPLLERLTTDVTVVLARAPLPMPQGGYGWWAVQPGPDGPGSNPQQAEDARIMVLRFIDQLRLAHPFDPRQVYVTGFSQGAALSASVGLTRPDKVAAIGILAGRILPQVKRQLAPVEKLSRLQAFLAYGEADTVIPSHLAVDTVHTMAEHRVQLAYRNYPCGHEISAQMADDFAAWVAQRAAMAYQLPDDA